MSEESVLRYRLEVVQLMPDGAYKSALIAGINASFAALRANRGQTTFRPRRVRRFYDTEAARRRVGISRADGD